VPVRGPSAAVCAPIWLHCSPTRSSQTPLFRTIFAVTTVCVILVTHGRHLSLLVSRSPGRAFVVTLLQLADSLQLDPTCQEHRRLRRWLCLCRTWLSALISCCSHSFGVLVSRGPVAAVCAPSPSALLPSALLPTRCNCGLRVTTIISCGRWYCPRRMPPSHASSSRLLLQLVDCVLVSWHDALVCAPTRRQAASPTRVRILLSRAAATRLVSVSWPRYS
jgi:hypothetical protein